MKPELIQHLHDLPSPPVLDVLGKWVFCRNARTGTTSICEGPLKSRSVRYRANPDLWNTVWETLVVPKLSDDAMIVFTFVRNPWDRICSAFHQCRDRARTEANKIDRAWEFLDWVKEVLAIDGPSVNRHFAEQYDTAVFDGKRIGLIGRYETIVEHWKIIGEQINCPLWIPRLNASEHGSYIDHYDDESRRIVGELYRREIETLGYEFGK